MKGKRKKRKEILHDEHLVQHHSQWMDYDDYDGESDVQE